MNNIPVYSDKVQLRHTTIVRKVSGDLEVCKKHLFRITNHVFDIPRQLTYDFILVVLVFIVTDIYHLPNSLLKDISLHMWRHCFWSIV